MVRIQATSIKSFIQKHLDNQVFTICNNGLSFHNKLTQNIINTTMFLLSFCAHRDHLCFDKAKNFYGFIETSVLTSLHLFNFINMTLQVAYRINLSLKHKTIGCVISISTMRFLSKREVLDNKLSNFIVKVGNNHKHI